jgi:hypothetical protein
MSAVSSCAHSSAPSSPASAPPTAGPAAASGLRCGRRARQGRAAPPRGPQLALLQPERPLPSRPRCLRGRRARPPPPGRRRATPPYRQSRVRTARVFETCAPLSAPHASRRCPSTAAHHACEWMPTGTVRNGPQPTICASSFRPQKSAPRTRAGMQAATET